MPRHYTPQDRQFVLDRVTTNRGDVNRTADEFGINARTIYKWRKKANIAQLPLTNLPPIAPIEDSKSLSVHGEGFREGLPSDDLQALLDLKAEMVRAAKYIAVNIIAAVEAAPLGQRVTALAQLIDRISKLAAQLPATEEEEILNFEGEDDYEDEDAAEDASSETSGDFEE
jgi:hypothetical protein